MQRRNLNPNESPFKFKNPDAARRRAELYDASKARDRAITDFLNQRTQRLRRKGD